MNLLPKLFIKDYQDYKNPIVRSKYGKLCGILGIVMNVILCSIKIITGFLIGSISIIADGINNLADAGSSVITLIGFKLSSMPADKDHPFGHQRYEYITGFLVSIIVLLIGLLLMKSSIEKLFSFEVQEFDKSTIIITILILIFGIVLKCIHSIILKKYGKLINSTALIATSADSLNDCISTATVLISMIVCAFYPNSFVDGVIGIAVSLFIIYSGIKLIKETISPLIGEAPSKEFIDDITDSILSYDGVLGLHDMTIHTYGPEKIFITTHVEVDSSVDVNISHDMIDNIEQDFLKNRNINLVIHLDPIETKCEDTLKLKNKIKDILYNIDPILKFHDFRIVKGNTHTNMIFDIVVPVKYNLTFKDIEERLTREVNDSDTIYNLVINFDQDFTGGNYDK